MGFLRWRFKVSDSPKLTDDQNKIKFQQEVAILWSLNNQLNVMKLIGYSNKPRCIITKLYPTDLFKYLHTPTNQITPKTIYHLATEIANGLNAIHWNHIAHRDIKSPNILLDMINDQDNSKMRAIICDFGIARSSSGSELPNTIVLNIQGMSPRYTAPEVFSHFKAKSARFAVPNSDNQHQYMELDSQIKADEITVEDEQKSDVYSFGVIVWEMLSRKRPWDDYHTLEEIEMQVMQGHREEIPSQQDKLMESLVLLIQTCWAQDPDKRPKISMICTQLTSFTEIK